MTEIDAGAAGCGLLHEVKKQNPINREHSGENFIYDNTLVFEITNTSYFYLIKQKYFNIYKRVLFLRGINYLCKLRLLPICGIWIELTDSTRKKMKSQLNKLPY